MTITLRVCLSDVRWLECAGYSVIELEEVPDRITDYVLCLKRIFSVNRAAIDVLACTVLRICEFARVKN